MRMDEARRSGIATVGSLRDLVSGVDAIFSTVFDDQSLRDIVFGPEGIVTHAKPNAVLVDMSTVSPAVSAEVAQALADAGLRYLRAPVSGTVSLARTAQLSTFVSGAVETFDEMRPLLACLTARQNLVGGDEEARVVKLMINLLVFLNTAALGEALAFGAGAGLDRESMLMTIDESIVGCAHYRAKTQKLVKRDYAPAGSLALVLKDMDLALAVAAASDASMPMSQIVHGAIADMVGRGFGRLDIAALADHDVKKTTLGMAAQANGNA
jgi:3-hydroxyisobutyrate dehydrogenase